MTNLQRLMVTLTAFNQIVTKDGRERTIKP